MALNEANLEVWEAEFMREARAYVASLVEQTILEIGKPGVRLDAEESVGGKGKKLLDSLNAMIVAACNQYLATHPVK
jgi:hypothetical protein